MEKENVVKTKSYEFAVKVVKLYKHILSEKKEFVLSKQFLRSGTSIGANVEEAIGGYSRKDFSAKLNIAYKESRETKYWLRLLHDTDYIEKRAFEILHNECDQLSKMLYSIIKTARSS